MSFQPPTLADRSFDDLVEDMLRRIPAHTPEWTNPRLGDPGRTLIELFAWLGDALLYRANLVPERQRLVFLKLLGLPLKPAQPARALVSLAFAQADTRTAATLRPGGRIGGAVPFETLGETTVLPVSAEAYIKRALSDQESARLGEVIDGLARVHRLNAAAKGYQTTPVFDGGKAVPAGVDVFANSADRALWLALLAPPAARPEEQPATNDAALAALGGGTSGRGGAAVARRRAGAGDAGAVRRNRTTRAGTGGVGNHHARPQRDRDGLSDARAVRPAAIPPAGWRGLARCGCRCRPSR